MVKFSIYIFSLLVLVSGCSSTSNKNSEPNSLNSQVENKKLDKKLTSTLECKNGQDIRKLEILRSNNGCQLAYTKQGETKNIASAVSGYSYCESIFQRIQGKLTASGYTCN